MAHMLMRLSNLLLQARLADDRCKMRMWKEKTYQGLRDVSPGQDNVSGLLRSMQVRQEDFQA